jgi:hypothetical protein
MARAAAGHHHIEGVSAHATFRYRTRVNPRAHDTAAEILADARSGAIRTTPPRWVTCPDPGDFYVTAPADDQRPDRCYLIRDGLVITVLVTNDPRRRGRGAGHGRRRKGRRNVSRALPSL